MTVTRFLIVYFLTAVIDYAAFFIVFTLTGGSILAAQVAGRAISIPFNYLTVRSKVFESEAPHQVAGPKFALLYAAAFFLAWGAIVWISSWLPIPNEKARVIVAKMIAEGSILIAKFYIQNHLIFQIPSGSLQSKPGC